MQREYTEMLRTLVPLESLSDSQFDSVLRNVTLEEASAGTVLFTEGDSDGDHVYVLSGAVELITSNGARQTVRGGSREARSALAPRTPRPATATACEEAIIARLDSYFLDVLLAWDQSAGLVVEELDEVMEETDPDWMTQLLRTKAFQRIPAANIQSLFMRLEPVSHSEGEVVIRQGEEGEYFYVIKEGRCAVTRIQPGQTQPRRLAELGPGDSFGEEALVSDAKRNATITLLTEGSLLRLSREDFDSLLKEPLINYLSYDEAKQRADNGALWLDVRLPAEYEAAHIGGSINVALGILREMSQSLSTDYEYIVYCDSGRRSAAAAFLLSERGFNVHVLKSGLGAVPQEAVDERRRA